MFSLPSTFILKEYVKAHTSPDKENTEEHSQSSIDSKRLRKWKAPEEVTFSTIFFQNKEIVCTGKTLKKFVSNKKK